MRATTQVVAAGVVGYLLWWGAGSLRLEIDGRAFVWPAAVGFGVVWAAREGVGRHAAALVLGALVGILALPVALDQLPLTAGGAALAIGVGAAAVAALVLIRWMPTGSAAVGFGTGIAASQAAGMDASTTASDVLAAGTAMGFAILLGVIAASSLSAVRDGRRRESEVRPELPRGELTVESGVTEEVPAVSRRTR